tara:strand:- start:416 stop:1186 length:771 start_codon:yes stop_codon:yes gene_type:complete
VNNFPWKAFLNVLDGLEAEKRPKIWSGSYESKEDMNKEISIDEYPLDTPLNYVPSPDPVRFSMLYNLLKDGNNKILNKTNKPIKILELGGGAGEAYITVKNLNTIEYNIIETQPWLEFGKKKTPSVNWIDINSYMNPKGNSHDKDIDIFYVRETMQYLDDYSDFLSKLLSFSKPKLLLFEHINFSAKETYWSCQNYSEKHIPWCWINMENFKTQIKNHGYSIIDEKIIDYQITGRTEDIKPELISDNVLDISFIKD